MKNEKSFYLFYGFVGHRLRSRQNPETLLSGFLLCEPEMKLQDEIRAARFGYDVTWEGWLKTVHKLYALHDKYGLPSTLMMQLHALEPLLTSRQPCARPIIEISYGLEMFCAGLDYALTNRRADR